jgi:predicted RNA-binding protein
VAGSEFLLVADSHIDRPSPAKVRAVVGEEDMCQVAVYLNQERIVEDVIWVEPVKDGILAKTFFDDPVHIKGTLKGIDLLKNRVILVSDEDAR